MHRVAAERDEDLRDFYLHKVSKFKSSQLVFVDESGSDEHGRKGWAPRGTPAVQISNLHRNPRYQILPAYAQDGIVLARVYQGTTDARRFDDFIRQLLHHCGRYPEPKSVLIMDNASWHHAKNIRQMCRDAGVKLLYLAPYSPDLAGSVMVCCASLLQL